jgi:hypothetical protein
MDADERADLAAILGLAGSGLALMIVGGLDLTGVAIVLAVLIPSFAACLIAAVLAAVGWRHATGRSTSGRAKRPTRSAGGGASLQCLA